MQKVAGPIASDGCVSRCCFGYGIPGAIGMYNFNKVRKNMKIFSWLFHALSWRVGSASAYQKHQCKEMVWRGNSAAICCLRAKNHLGKCSFDK